MIWMNMYFHSHQLNMAKEPNLVVGGREPHVYGVRGTLGMTPPSPHCLPGCRAFGDPPKWLQGFGNVKDKVRLGLVTAWRERGAGTPRKIPAVGGEVSVLLLGLQQLRVMGRASSWAATQCLGWAPRCSHLGDGWTHEGKRHEKPLVVQRADLRAPT